MVTLIHAQQPPVQLWPPALAVLDDPLRRAPVGHMDDGTVCLALDPEDVVGLGARGVAQQVVLLPQPADLLELIRSCFRGDVANIDLCGVPVRGVDEAVPRQLPPGHTPVLLHRSPHVIDATVDVLYRPVLRVPRPLCPVVRLPEGILSLLLPLPPHVLGHLPMVCRAVKVLLHMVGLCHVHGGHSHGARLVHLPPLQLPHLLQVRLVVLSQLVRFDCAIGRNVPDGRLPAVAHCLLVGLSVCPLHRPGQPRPRGLVHMLVGRGLPDPLAVIRVTVDNLGLAGPRVPHPPMDIPLDEV
mmetsp:Transcript_22348/g.55048  ORF Transcript_22348/g.55048 Transcript_22348/m.55048 type:complete len:298 (+) Transcript_22348:817-1710(+)